MNSSKGMAWCLVASILTISSAMAEEPWQASWIGVSKSAVADAEAPEIVVTRALYGVSGDPAKQVDLTRTIQQELAGGNFTIRADNATAGRDPAHGTTKTLELEYTVDGQAVQRSLAEDTALDLATGQPVAAEAKSPPRAANRWICFRKVVRLDETPGQALTRIAADSKYWLWINGERVVFEGQLKRGPTPDDTYYDRVDLAQYLRPGDNTIAVLLWYFGKHGFSHKSSGQAGLVFEADIGGRPLLSGSNWKALVHPAYENTGEPHPNFRLPESNLRFDARNDLRGWQDPGFDDAAWPAAAEFGVPPCGPWNRLVERPIPPWKDYGLNNYANAAELPKVSDGTTIKAKLPYNAQVTPYLKIEGPAGQLIDLRTDQYNVGGPNIRAEYVTREGVQEYENLGWMNGHEIHYTIPAGFKIHALKYRETGYDTAFTGTFKCDDEFLNRLRQKGLRTLYITMRDTYMDCPDRERAQWWGDMVNEMGEAFYALDTNSIGLAKKGILELANWQRPNHTLYSPIPDGNWNRELPMQMLNSVGYYGFWTYYLYSGDLETIRAVYPAVKRYLEVWKLGDDGLVIPRKGEWTWGDWGKNKDMTVLYNGWYYLALKGQLNMARALGEERDVAGIEAKMQSIEQNFNKTFWTGSEYRSPGYQDKTDDRAHALAVLAGLAKPDQYDAIRDVFRTQEHSSPYLEKYVGEALYVMRFEADAIARTKKRFQPMVDHWTTTLWEHWQAQGGTVNHAWSGGTLTLLSQYAAGVAPVTPGFETYHVLPQMGPLKHIKTTVPSVKGDIELELVNEADSFTMNLTSPADTTAIIGIPKEAGIAITGIDVNGVSVWVDGKPGKALPGLAFVKETEHYLTFSAAPGTWGVRVEKKVTHGKWIWGAGTSDNRWICFRKKIDLGEVPQKASARIAVDSKYWLWVNGELAVFEGGLNRGPAPGAGYYDEIDLAPYLQSGENTLAILAWYWGNEGRNNVDSGAGGLLFEADWAEAPLFSDSSWKVKLHPAYGNTAGDRPSYLYGGHNIGFDARVDIPDWFNPPYDDADWEAAEEKGVPPCQPWGPLEARPIPQWKDFGLRSYKNDGALPGEGGGGPITAELPHAAMVSPYLEIDAPAGLTIDIRTDRFRVQGGPGDGKNFYNSQHTEYTTREGIQAFESLNWLFGERVIYTMPEGVKIRSLKYRESGYGCDFRGGFESDDAFLNALWEKSRRTLYICMRDNYMDCPDRERGQWIGDVSSQVLQTFYCLDRQSDKLTVKCINDFIRWKQGDVLRGNVPGKHAGELPSQSLHAISDHGILLPYYLHTGDLAPVRMAYPAIINYLKLWKTKDDGLVEARRGNWHWFDHLRNQDKTVMENCWYYAALKAARQMADLVGADGDHDWLDGRITAIEESFDQAFWKPDGYQAECLDERANALAVVFGLAGKDKYPVIRKILNSQENGTPYMEAYVLEALLMMGHADDAFSRMKKRYEGMVEADTTTLWEDFSGVGTLNHAWSGAPLSLLCKYGAGIAPMTPGYETYQVLPQLGPLKHIKTTVPSVKGDIAVELRNEPDVFTMNLTSPEGTTAMVGIPRNTNLASMSITANGVTVWRNGKPDTKVRGIADVKETEHYISFSVKPGSWVFQSE